MEEDGGERAEVEGEGLLFGEGEGELVGVEGGEGRGGERGG